MNKGTSSSAMPFSNLPDWCQHPNYNRYWGHYEELRSWFVAHRNLSAEQRQQDALKNAQSSSYWMHYFYHTMMYHQQQYYQHLTRRRQNTSSIPQTNHSPGQRSKQRKRKKKRSRCRGSKKVKSSSGATDVVLDLDPDVLSQEVIECHMEITDEMVEFFAQSAKHRQERDSIKKEKTEGCSKEDYVNISQATTRVAMATTEAPREQAGSKRSSEMKMLYGRGAAMIHGMETALQLTFDRYLDLKQPPMWPHLPLNLNFS